MYADSLPILPLVFVVAVAIALALLYRAAQRAITIAELEVDDGGVRIVFGGIAPGVLRDLRDIARRPKISGARIYITRSRGRAEVRVEGNVNADQKQRIRNVVGSVPLAKLLNAHRR
ncbi:MAG: hypothetical protein JWM74_5221 [Myxococcaceae bacterium]|nr:hypothetical protein [Myxococcaceae bacterium]